MCLVILMYNKRTENLHLVFIIQVSLCRNDLMYFQ